jgi:hypothetical protein
MVVPPDIDGLPPAELKQVLVKLLEENAEQKRVIAELRDEVARLKGLKGRPPIKPSGMENATASKPGEKRPRRRGRGKAVPRVAVEEQVLKAEVPAGSRFKGYEDFVVQDLELRVRVIRYRRERWFTPDGRTVIAPLPPGVRGHVGPELCRFVLAQYHQGQVTVPRLLALLQAIGVGISKRQLVRLLIDGQEEFLRKRAMCCAPGSRQRAGSRWMTPGRGIKAPTGCARRSATTTSPGSARREARAG